MLKTAWSGEVRPPVRAVLRAWWPLAGVVLLALAASSFTRTDADLWGHVQYGLDWLDTWSLPAVDPYSFTQDRPWVNHEWFSELQMAIAWRLGETAGMAALKGALAFTTLAVIWTALDGAKLWVRLAVLVVVGFGTVHMTSSLRPQLWTFLIFALVCRILVSNRSGARWALPALFAVWANVHGGWVVGVGVLGAWAAGEIIADRRTIGRWAALGASCVGATLITPYGVGLWWFVAGTVRMERDITEWGPLWGTDWFTMVPWFATTAVAVALLRRSSPHRLAAGLVLGMLAYASMNVMRIGSLYVEAAAILLAPHLVARWPAGLATLPRVRPRGEGIVAAVVFVVLTGLAGGLTRTTTSCFPMLSPWMPDTVAGDMLKSAQPGRLVTFFDWGQYALWHFGPDLKVSMDGRRETVYTDARLDEHDAILAGRPAGLAVLASWQAEYVWLPASSETTRRWLVTHGYRLEVQTERSFVAVREDLPPLTAPAEDSIRRLSSGTPCFPA